MGSYPKNTTTHNSTIHNNIANTTQIHTTDKTTTCTNKHKAINHNNQMIFYNHGNTTDCRIIIVLRTYSRPNYHICFIMHIFNNVKTYRRNTKTITTTTRLRRHAPRTNHAIQSISNAVTRPLRRIISTGTRV